MRKKIHLKGLSSNSQYHLNRLCRCFERSLLFLGERKQLTAESVKILFTQMGYFHGDLNEQDRELVNTVLHMIGHEGKASKESLLRFILIVEGVNTHSGLDEIIHNVCQQNKGATAQARRREENTSNNTFPEGYEKPLVTIELGYFTEGRWQCTLEQMKQIRTIFKPMQLKRISGREVPEQSYPKPNFQPRILKRSAKMLQNRLRKLNIDVHERVQDRLLLNQSLTRSSIEREIHRSKEKQMENCTFKPFINHGKRKLGKENVSLNNSFESIGSKLMQKGREYEERRRILSSNQISLNQSLELNHCTFKPGRTRMPSFGMTQVRNAQKSVARIVDGRKTRELQRALQNREYPQNISWGRFVRTLRSDSPILCIDLKLGEVSQQIQVFEGESIKKIVGRIGEQHRIDRSRWGQVERIVINEIRKCREVCLRGLRVHYCQ